MGRFNLDDYEPVADRLERFWADHPDGSVLTEQLDAADGDVRFVAVAWFDRNGDRHPAASGYASETVGGRGVNATSALENCETSAVGRALANAGYSPKGGARPSREEMQAAQAAQQPATHDDDGVPYPGWLQSRGVAWVDGDANRLGDLQQWLAEHDAQRIAELSDDHLVALEVQLEAWEAGQ